jgi:hypothetical protein
LYATLPFRLCDTAIVNNKLRAWLLIVGIAAICGATVWGVASYRARTLKPAALVKRLPTSDALVLYVDFSALRRANILAILENQKITEDPEYQDFVRKTDFDYKQDLDTALVAFAPAGKFLLLRGRFDWKNLRSYVESQSGNCYNTLCRMPGSTQDRHISFFPLQSNLMALAVSDDDSAALRMQNSAAGPEAEVPDAPLWLAVPNSILKSGVGLPAGTRPFARSMENVQSLTISFSPEGNRLAARLNARCHSSQEAAALAGELSRTTDLLRQMIAREHHSPNPADLSGVLTAGSFHHEDTRVVGYWPIERSFVENLLGGS